MSVIIPAERYRLPRLVHESQSLGKPEWRPMLEYTARLHERSILPPRPPFRRPWEEIGPGYQNSPAFGHWDIVHAIIDVSASEPDHALDQIKNDLELQLPTGFLPGVIWMKYEQPDWSTTQSHPPVWTAAVDAYAAHTGDRSILGDALAAADLQLAWFERERKARDGGYYYADVTSGEWESGVDEGCRFVDLPARPQACVDATAHVALLCRAAAEWSAARGCDGGGYEARLAQIGRFVRTRMFGRETGFFHDAWTAGDPRKRMLAFEGIWPLVAGIASPDQARRVIDENLLNPRRFFAKHPITTVAREDPRFEKRMWRGPSWNSMTFWASTGCLRYGRPDAASLLLEAALDGSARQFDSTGTIWEFYDPDLGDPRALLRKPGTARNCPCSDYLGHNPLLAMARLWERTLK